MSPAARNPARHERSNEHEDPRDPDRNRRRHQRLARGDRPRQAPPAARDRRPRMDGTASDLRLRDRAPRGRDRRRHRRGRPRLRAQLLRALAPRPARLQRMGRAGAGGRPAVEATRHRAGRRPLGRADSLAHRSRRRPAPLPPQRDPRHPHRARVRLRRPRPPARLRREQALARMVQPNAGRARAGAVRAVPAEPAPDRSRRRHTRATARPHPRADRRAHRRGRPHRLPRRRQLLHAGADAPRESRRRRTRRGGGTAHPRAHPRLRRGEPDRLPRRPRPRYRSAPRRAEACPSTPSGGGRVIAFETSTRINRPIEDVFSYVSDPLNFPRWNSAVQAVRKTSAGENGVRSTYVMERELPTTGRAINELEVVASERPSEFVIRATAGPTPFLYRYRFAAENDETVIQLDAEVELPGAAALLPQLARRAVRKGVEDNFATLKQILETARRRSRIA